MCRNDSQLISFDEESGLWTTRWPDDDRDSNSKEEKAGDAGTGDSRKPNPNNEIPASESQGFSRNSKPS
jgi:hypothetical protein